MSKSVGIIAYGKQSDRKKLEALAKLEGETSSSWIVRMIRERYMHHYGETDPDLVV